MNQQPNLGSGERCPHGLIKDRCQRCQADERIRQKGPAVIDNRSRERELGEAERFMTRGARTERRAKLPQLIERLRSGGVDAETEARIAFMESFLKHEDLNEYYLGETAFLGKKATKEGKKVDKLDRGYVRQAEEEWLEENRTGGRRPVDILALEDELLGLYDRASASSVSLKYFDLPYDAQVLKYDILYRRAQRIDDPAERERALDAIDRATKSLEALAPNNGKKRELQLMRCIRQWAQENGTDHLVRVDHGLPTGDADKSTDLELSFGTKPYRMDLKTWTQPTENEVSEARDKASAAGSRLVLVSPDTIRSATQGDAGPAFGARKEIVATLAGELASGLRQADQPAEAKRIRAMLGASKKVEATPETERAARRSALFNALTVGLLLKLNAIPNTPDLSKLAAARGRMVDVAMRMIERDSYDLSGLNAKKPDKKAAALDEYLRSATFQDAYKAFLEEDGSG
jgi:hypothetical protein